MTPQQSDDYIYVTLGGTELRDVQSARFIDARLVSKVISYEDDSTRYESARKTVATLVAEGLDVTLHHGSFFDYERTSERPHFFFLDLPGICASNEYDHLFGEMFQERIIREGDLLLITSYLGRNRGLDVIQEAYSGELSVLKITNAGEVRNVYRRAHPSFTLYRGLSAKGIASEVKVRCVGCVSYKDKSPMGLYGYIVTNGATDFRGFIQDADIHYFKINQMRKCSFSDF